jgi:hypothetical protein
LLVVAINKAIQLTEHHYLLGFSGAGWKCRRQNKIYFWWGVAPSFPEGYKLLN